MKKMNKGFTLIELIIVIAILGIIALIAVPNLAGIRQRSQVSADIRTAEQIGKSIRIWQTDADADATRTIPGKGSTPEILWYAYADEEAGEGFIKFAGIDYYVGVDYVAESLSTSAEGATPTYFISSIGEGTDQKIIVGIDDLAADGKSPAGGISLTYTPDGGAETDITKDWILANKYNGSAPGWAYVEQ